jgi:hypothetical protein
MRRASGEAPGSWAPGLSRKEREAGVSIRRCRVRAALRGGMIGTFCCCFCGGGGGGGVLKRRWWSRVLFSLGFHVGERSWTNFFRDVSCAQG